MRKPQLKLLSEDLKKWLGKKFKRSTGLDAADDRSTALRLLPPGGF
ncbi:hypothetical protein [Haloarcula brevis]